MRLAIDPHRSKARSLCETLIVCAAFICACSIAGCGSTLPNMDDYVDRPADKVVEELRSLGGDFSIVVVSENGAPVNVDDADQLSKLKVVSTNPAKGEPIESGVISLYVKSSGGMLASWAKDSFGVERVDQYNDGTMSIVRVYVPGYAAEGSAVEGDSNLYGRSANAKLFEQWSGVLKHDYIIGMYTNDGFLYSITYVPYVNSTKEQMAYGAACAVAVANEADQFAKANRQSFEQGLADRLGAISGMTGAEWRERGDGAFFYVYSDAINPKWDADSAAETDDVRIHYQGMANWATYMTRENVTITFYDGNDSAFDSFSDTAKSWLPDTVVTLAEQNEIPLPASFEYQSY